jgi:hypothetical protein
MLIAEPQRREPYTGKYKGREVEDGNAEYHDFKVAFSAKGKATRVPNIAQIPVTPQLLVIISKDE